MQRTKRRLVSTLEPTELAYDEVRLHQSLKYKAANELKSHTQILHDQAERSNIQLLSLPALGWAPSGLPNK